MQKIYYDFSPIGGSGIFAKRLIRKNEIVFRIRGREKIKHAYVRTFSPTGPSWVAIGKEQWLITNSTNPWPYINHSCNPNVGFKGALTIVAMRTIRPREEILIDYATTEEDPYWKMKCVCRAKNCRKEIKSVSFLPPRLLKKYKDYLPKFLKHLASTTSPKKT